MLLPALAGLGVFLFCQAALGFFRSWNEDLRTESLLALTVPRPADTVTLGGASYAVVCADPAPAPAAGERRPRRVPRAAAKAPPRSAMDSLQRALALAACILISGLLHGSIFVIARRVQTAPPTSPEPERAGVYLARIVSAPDPEPAPPEPPREEPIPPPKPAAPEPPPPEPPKPEAPKPEPPEPAALTEKPPAEAPAKTEAPPPAPAAVAEAEPEPRSKKTEIKEAERPQPAAAPPAARVTETPRPADPAPHDAPAPAAAAPPKPGPEPSVLGQGAPLKAREKEDAPAGASGISTMKEYRQFLAREMTAGSREGQYVPNLRFGDNKAQENREIMRYFGMELIAYPKNQKFYVYIDPDNGLFSRSNDFAYIHNFSSRAIFRTSPYFDALRAQAARKVDVPPESLVVAQLLKPSSAAYIGWKEAECARRAGVPLEAVEACEASFVKSPFGVWIVRIDRLLMKDGRTLPVEDFEWAKVSTSGGER
jgi:hypothetical protein